MKSEEYTRFVAQERARLAEELAHFERRKAEWEVAQFGRWVLLKGDKEHGFFDTMEEAYSAGLHLFGNEPMLIKQLGEPVRPAAYRIHTELIFHER